MNRSTRPVPVAHAHEAGFTLIELMVVTAIISIVAGVAVPNLLSSRAIANENAVLATMRTIATAETESRLQDVVDVDHDGIGEALGLAEMAGAEPLRSGSARMRPPTLGAAMGTLDPNGRLHTKGYLICLYLPDASGVGLPGNAANAANIDPDQAENAWSCVAWPLTRGGTGSKSFFVNQTGEVLVAKDATYGGSLNAPPAGAALLSAAPTVIVDAPIAANTVGADGNMWRTVR